MNYIDRIAHAIYEHGNPESEPDDNEMILYRMYALLVLVKGMRTTLEDIHDAWSAWQSQTMPDHRSIVPFDELSGEVQIMDLPYQQAVLSARHRMDAGEFD